MGEIYDDSVTEAEGHDSSTFNPEMVTCEQCMMLKEDCECDD